MTSTEIKDYVLHTPTNTNSSVLEDLLLKYSDTISHFYEKSNLTKIEDYLYSIDYDIVDYNAGLNYAKKYKVNFGGCSSVVTGNIYGRNYDWYYDNSISFITKVIGAPHKSIGVSTLAPIDRAFVE